jgi:hypothetical protein
MLAVGVEVVRRISILDAPEGLAPTELVGVEDELPVALRAERLEGLR